MSERTTVVDGHVHVFLKASERYPREVHQLYPAELEAPVELLLEVMQTNGVDKAVLVPLSLHDGYLKECLERHPGRFAGIGVHASGRPDQLGDYRRRVETVGIQGLRLFDLGLARDGDVESLPTFPLLEVMASNRHKLWFYPPPGQLGLIAQVLARLPSLQVVLNHLGFCQQGFGSDEHGRPRVEVDLPPSTLTQVVALARFPTVSVMLSGEYAFSRQPYPHEDLREVVQELYRAFGANRILWASDFPWTLRVPGYPEQLALVDHYLPDLSPRERAAIFGGTALSLFEF